MFIRIFLQKKIKNGFLFKNFDNFKQAQIECGQPSALTFHKLENVAEYSSSLAIGWRSV